MYYINCFWVYSIIGFILETISYSIFKWSGESGILYGPWTPLYGFGAVIIIFTTKYIFKNLKKNKYIKFFLVFLFNFFLLSFIELVGGIFINKLLLYLRFLIYKRLENPSSLSTLTDIRNKLLKIIL